MIENFFAFWGRPVLAMVAGLEKFGKFLIFHIVQYNKEWLLRL